MNDKNIEKKEILRVVKSVHTKLKIQAAIEEKGLEEIVTEIIESYLAKKK